MDALEQLNLAAPIVDIYLEVESAIINHIARQLTANPDTMINATSEWRILMLARMGRLNKDTARIISSKVKKVPDKVQSVVNNAIDNILTEYGLEMTDKLSGNIFKALENYDRQAVKDKYNQVNTVMQYKAKQIYRNSVNAVADRFDRMMQEKLENSQEYLDVLNKQALAVTLGETSRTQALRETITEMSEKGIPAFVDASGREWSPEAYVNMDIRNTAKNAALAAEFASLDELGQDIILVSAHAGARPRCYPFQGKFYSRSGKSGTIKDARGREYKFEPFGKTSFGEAAGLFGINCGHRMRGVSDGTFINREEHYSEKENSEEYEKVCKQRQMERKIRADKRTQEALEAAGDTEGAKAVKKRIAAENKALRAYCDKEGLTYRQDRTQIYGYFDPKRKKKPVNFVETVDKSGENGIINIEIDEFVPCLKDSKTAEILATEVKTLAKSEYSKYSKSNGWNIDWKNIPDNEEVLGVYLKNGKEPQGLIAIRKEKGGVYLSYASTAPQNNKLMNNGAQKYIGVGGHLFAAAIEESVKSGNKTGCVYGYAANKEVLKHYMEKFGAIHLPVSHEFQFLIDGNAAQKIIETYNFERR